MTRSEAEAEILEIVSAGMVLVGISVAPVSGVVPTLNTALRAGLKSVGITPAERTVTDADFADVDASEEDKVVWTAAIHIIDKQILTGFNRPDWSDNGSSESWGSLLRYWSDLARSLRADIESVYPSSTAIVIGSMSLNTIEPCDDESEC